MFHELFGRYKICLNSSVDNDFYSGVSLMVGISQQNYGFIQLKSNIKMIYKTGEKPKYFYFQASGPEHTTFTKIQILQKFAVRPNF